MQEGKVVDFNPLDILATAAALQRVDNKGNKVDATTMTQQNSDNDNEDTHTSSADRLNKDIKLPGNGICKLKVMFTSENFDKMLKEHNYGNACKNKLGLCTLNTDVSPQGKDKKVFVALVDKSGDHHVLKTIKAVKYVNDKSDSNLADSDIHVNNSPAYDDGAPEGSSSQYISIDTQTNEINKCQDQSSINQDTPAASQVTQDQVSGEENVKNNRKITEINMCGDNKSVETVTDQGETETLILNEKSGELECINDKGHVRMISTLPDPDIAPLSQPQTFVINISHQGGVLSSQLECQQEKGDKSSNNSEIPEVKHHIIRTLLTSSQNKEDSQNKGDIVEVCLSGNQKVKEQSKYCESEISKENYSELSKMCFSDSVGINSDSVKSMTESEHNNSVDSVHIDDSIISKELTDSETFNQEKNELSETKLIGASSSSDIGITDQTIENTQLNQLGSDVVEKVACLKQGQLRNHGSTSVSDSNLQLVPQKTEETMDSDNCSNNGVKIEKSTSSIHPGVDHCYAGVLNKPHHSIDNMEDSSLDGTGYDDTESPQSVVSDLSQDSGFSDSGHSPDGVDLEGNRFIHSQFLNRPKEATPSSHMSASESRKSMAILEIPPPVAHHTSPKVGKYRIGTFASVSNSTMGLESPKLKTQLLSHLTSARKRPASLLTNSIYTSSLLNNDTVDGDIIQISNSDEVISENKYAVPGTAVKKTDIEHDHDYCLPWVYHASSVSNSPSSKLLRDAALRDGIKMRDKKSESFEKRRRISSASSDKDFCCSLDEAALSSPDSLLSSPLPSTLPQNVLQSSTRNRVKLEKIADYVKTGNSDSKLKITGSFQDDYIYFLNTKSRSRRRTSHDVKPPVPPDKILIPLPKPGDIVVPHLTDADLELIKQRRNGCKKSALQEHTQFLPPAPSSSLPQNAASVVPGCENKPNVGDEDSKNIIDTILSMESGEPSPYVGSEVSAVETSSFGDNFGLAFSPEQMNLTPEQMEILYSAMDEVTQADTVTTSKNVESDSKCPNGSVKVIGDVSQSNEEEKSDSLVDAKDSLSITNTCHQQLESSNNNTDSSKKSTPSQDFIISVKENKEKTVGESEILSKPVVSTDSKDNISAISVSEPSKIVAPSIVKSALPSISGSQSVVNSLPDIPFTSMDKSSLDLFGSELRLFPEASVTESSTPTTVSNNEYDAPWIVTVSMYWNDLPAIMIDNLPFVRLVDIHKQILPAKDTGILKKRCQLLGIDVKNCSEMQRYFLVQYGKAFNSKSTLIVSKEDAVSLIGYYVNPVPKVHRSENEKSDRKKIVDSSSYHKVSKSSARSNHHETVNSLKLLESLPQKRQEVIPVEPIPAPVVEMSATFPLQNNKVQNEQVSRRTRHKKINFLEMLKGDQNNNTSESVDIEGKSCEDEEQVKSVNSVKEIEKGKDKSNKKVPLGTRKKSPVNKEKMKSVSSASDLSHDEQSCNESETENRTFDKDAIFVNPKRQISSLNAKKARLERNKKQGSLKVKWTIFNKTKKKLIDSKHEKREILAVIHKDLVAKNGHKSKVQSGSVFLDQFESHNSACVRCCTCKKFISIENFLIHLHELGGNGKLIDVIQPQTLALRDMYPSETQKRLWKIFQEKLKYLKEVEQKNSESVMHNKMDLVNEKDQISEKVDSSGSDIRKSCDVQQNYSGTRISCRKRKQKQLYPIENYSFSKSQPVRKLIESDEEPPRSPLLERSCDTYDDSPVKRIKLDTNHNDTDIDIGRTFASRLDSKSGCGGVVTLTNGPEMTTFTALADDDFDL